MRDFSSSSQAVSGRYILWILLYVFLAVLLDLCLESPHTSENVVPARQKTASNSLELALSSAGKGGRRPSEPTPLTDTETVSSLTLSLLFLPFFPCHAYI